jgi:hypothetical protein
MPDNTSQEWSPKRRNTGLARLARPESPVTSTATSRGIIQSALTRCDLPLSSVAYFWATDWWDQLFFLVRLLPASGFLGRHRYEFTLARRLAYTAKVRECVVLWVGLLGLSLRARAPVKDLSRILVRSEL